MLLSVPEVETVKELAEKAEDEQSDNQQNDAEDNQRHAGVDEAYEQQCKPGQREDDAKERCHAKPVFREKEQPINYSSYRHTCQ